MSKICLVEDDPTIRELVGARLRKFGYQVAEFETAELAECESESDLYIVDVMLPGALNGMEFCEKVRKRAPMTPILILSAMSESSDRVNGLRAGADDYLTKPFEMEELLLRVDGMLRRRSWYRNVPSGHLFEWDENGVNFANLEGNRGSERFTLTQKEAMLLKLLVENEGNVVTRDEILNTVWGYHSYPSTRTIDNFVVRLRKLYESEPSQPRYIHSVRGLGYRFTR